MGKPKAKLKSEIIELISRRRRQLMVHSALYYTLDESIISDHLFDAWSVELVKLQKEHPKESRKAVFFKLFSDFDGSTGFHLANNSWALHKAKQLLNYHKKLVEQEPLRK